MGIFIKLEEAQSTFSFLLIETPGSGGTIVPLPSLLQKLPPTFDPSLLLGMEVGDRFPTNVGEVYRIPVIY